MKKEIKVNNEQLKLRIAEFIGEIKGRQVKINGKEEQVIIDAPSLIEFLKDILKKI